MNKIFLVIQREYLTRAKKPSFWILTILVPILLAALYAVPVLLAVKPVKTARVLVVDDTQLFAHAFQNSEVVAYSDAASLEEAEAMLANNDSLAAIVYIPKRETTIPGDAFLYYRKDAPNIDVQNDVNRQLQEILRNNILLDVHNISAEDYALITGTKITLHTKDIETGRDGFLEIKNVVGLMLGLLIFCVIIAFGSQVMRGVMEEKNNRIVEIVISSVKPFQLMMGKVIGICAVGLTQIVLWMLLSVVAVGAIQASHSALFQAAQASHNITEVATKGTDATVQMLDAMQANDVSELIQGLISINFGVLMGMFLFYFLFGYLLYATLFAAVGAVADPDTDGNLFVLPLTSPLILTILLSVNMMRTPSGALATWLSIIPFTSPMAMLMRIPFGVPYWQLVLSAVLLLAFFPLCTWLAAKIYRRGILLFGTKITYKTIGQWLKNE